MQINLTTYSTGTKGTAFNRIPQQMWQSITQLPEQPFLGQLLQLAHLVRARHLGLALQRHLAAGVHHLQLDVAVARGVKDEAQREGHAAVGVFAFVGQHDESRLVAGESFLELVDGYFVVLLVDDDLLTLSVHLNY